MCIFFSISFLSFPNLTYTLRLYNSQTNLTNHRPNPNKHALLFSHVGIPLFLIILSDIHLPGRASLFRLATIPGPLFLASSCFMPFWPVRASLHDSHQAVTNTRQHACMHRTPLSSLHVPEFFCLSMHQAHRTQSLLAIMLEHFPQCLCTGRHRTRSFLKLMPIRSCFQCPLPALLPTCRQ
jgi:hypothetical protein